MKTALITGGASGIGKACVEKMAREGYGVVIADVNLPGAEALAEQLKAEGLSAIAVHMDVADVHGVSSLSGDIAPQYSTWREKRKDGEKETGGKHRSPPAGVIFFPEEPDRRCGPIPPRPPR